LLQFSDCCFLEPVLPIDGLKLSTAGADHERTKKRLAFDSSSKKRDTTTARTGCAEATSTRRHAPHRVHLRHTARRTAHSAA